MALNATISIKGRAGKQYGLSSDIGEVSSIQDLFTIVKASLIATAKEVRREETSKGFDPKATVRVDGKFGRIEESVKTFGKIEYIAAFNALFELPKLYLQIIKKSPIDSGTFRDHNYVFHNNTLVATNYFELESWVKSARIKSNDTVRFMNITPYSQNLESNGVVVAGKKKLRNVTRKNRGKNAGKTGRGNKEGRSTRRRENGTYYQSYQLYRKFSKFDSKNLRFEFYKNGSYGLTIREFSASTQSAPFRSSYSKTGKPYHYPSILIRIP